MIKVLFVCLGNICRSPTAEGIFRHYLNSTHMRDKICVDSAGTSGWHVNDPPDQRTQMVAKTRGINLSELRSRRVNSADFEEFDYIVAMDQQNLTDLLERCPSDRKSILSLLLSFAPELNRKNVPDPYYHGSFDEVFDMIELATKKLYHHIEDDYQR